MHARPLAVRLAAAAVAAAAVLLPAVQAGAASSSSSGAGSGAASSGGSSASSSGSSTGSASAGSSPDIPLAGLPGEIVALSDSDNYGSSGTETLAVSAPDGADRRLLLSTTTATLGLLSVSPDGSDVAYFSGTSSSARIEVMDLATKKVTSPYALKGTTAFIAGIAWTPDGDHLVFASNIRPGKSPDKESALYEIGVDGKGLTRLTPFDDAGSPAVAPDGDLVYVTSTTFSRTSGYDKSTLWLAGPSGSAAEQLLASSRFIAQPVVSPDGQTVVFSLTASTTTSHLASVGINGQGLTTLTPAVKNRSDILPTWSPDGSEIAFLSSRAGRYENNASNQLMDAYVMTASGADVTPLITFKGGKKSMDLIAWGT